MPVNIVRRSTLLAFLAKIFSYASFFKIVDICCSSLRIYFKMRWIQIILYCAVLTFILNAVNELS